MRRLIALMMVGMLSAPVTAGEATRALLDALARCPAEGPCVTRIEPGNYVHDSFLKIRGLTDTTIEADGVHFNIPAGPIDCRSTPWLKFVDPNRVTFRGISILDAGSTSYGCAEQTHGITSGGGYGMHIDRVRIIGVGDEAVQIGTDGSSITNSEFGECVREVHAYAGCVVVHGARGVSIRGNTFTGNTNPKANGVRIEASQRHGTHSDAIMIEHNFFQDMQGGIIIGVSNDVDGVTIDQNIFTNVERPIGKRAIWGSIITNVEEGTNLFLERREK